MQDYIATFYSDFGALSFCRGLQNLSVQAELMPTPRKLSSSCGVCVGFRVTSQDDEGEDKAGEKDFALRQAQQAIELEGLYLVTGHNMFETLLHN